MLTSTTVYTIGVSVTYMCKCKISKAECSNLDNIYKLKKSVKQEPIKLLIYVCGYIKQSVAKKLKIILYVVLLRQV